MWLVRHLEVIRILMLEDLLTAKKHLVHCFPPEQSIFQYCVSLYHGAVTQKILDIINNGLEGTEVISLLQWVVQTYSGPELLGNEDLGLETDMIPAVLAPEEIHRLEQSYLATMRYNYVTWMTNAIEQEQKEWSQEEGEPEVDSDGCFYTSTPFLINRMVEDNLLVSKTISETLVNKTMILSLENVQSFGKMYLEAVRSFQELETNINENRRFWMYNVAICNNMNKFSLMFQKTLSNWPCDICNPENDSAVKEFFSSFEEVSKFTIEYLSNKLFGCVNSFYNSLFDDVWLSNFFVEEILNSYNEKFEILDKLGRGQYGEILKFIKKKSLIQYLTSLMRRKLSLTTDENRKEGSLKILSETEMFNEFFAAVAVSDEEDSGVKFDVLINIANIIGASEDMITFDLMTLISKNNGINEEHIISILYLRGMSKSEAKEMANDLLQDNTTSDQKDPEGVFEHVKVYTGLTNVKNLFLEKF